MIYEYRCPRCGWAGERISAMSHRDLQHCPQCDAPLERQVSVPSPAQFKGRVVQGGGPDRFTADVMGIPLKDLPSGLRTTPSPEAAG